MATLNAFGIVTAKYQCDIVLEGDTVEDEEASTNIHEPIDDSP